MHANSRLIVVVALASGLMAAEGMAIRHDAQAGTYTICDGERPVLVYHFATVPVPPGVGGTYAVARSGYIHPLHGPDGEELTRDWSPDHPHHRGIYWAWPEVVWQGGKRDHHALQGMSTRPVRIVRQDADAQAATLQVVGEWLWDDRTPIVREDVTIRAGRWLEGCRIIDIALRFDPLVEGVTLARRGTEKYGGLNIRLSTRQGQAITTRTDPAGLPWGPAWADIMGVPPGGRRPIGLAILPSSANPRHPADWVQYPELNWLQPAFPAARERYPLEKGRILALDYRLVIHDQSWSDAQGLARWQACQPPGYRLASIASWRMTGSRKALIAVEQAILRADAAERGRHEADLIALCADPAATHDIRGWACGQLALIGTAAAVPSLAALAQQPATAHAACIALAAIPDPAAESALVVALGANKGEPLLQIIAAVARRRCMPAVAALEALARGGDETAARAALAALGEVGGPDAAAALGRIAVAPSLTACRSDAILACAQRLTVDGRMTEAAALCRPLLATDVPAVFRPRALLGWAAADPAAALPSVLEAFAGEQGPMQDAAITVLRQAPGDAMRKLADGLVGWDGPRRVLALDIIARRGDASVLPQVAACLDDGDEAVRCAAITAIGMLGDARQVAMLAALAARNGAIGMAAGEALVRLRDAAVDEAVRTVLRDAAASTRPVLVECLVKRRDPASVALLLQLARETDGATAAAARKGLGAMASAVHLAEVLRLLDATSADDAEDVGRVLVAVCNRVPDRAAAIAQVLAAVADAGPVGRAALVGIMPALGDERCLALVRTMAAAPGPVQDAAWRAMTAWKDARVLSDLRTLLTVHPPPHPLGILAVRALVRLGSQPGIAEADRLACIVLAMEAGRRPEERTAAVVALGGLRSLAAVERLVPLLDDADLRGEAARAITVCCLPQDRFAGLAGETVRQALVRTRDLIRDEAIRKRIDRHLDAIQTKGKP